MICVQRLGQMRGRSDRFTITVLCSVLTCKYLVQPACASSAFSSGKPSTPMRKSGRCSRCGSTWWISQWNWQKFHDVMSRYQIFDLETAAASVASSLQGGTSPPSSGQSPKGADILDLLVAATALRPRTVASFPAVTAPPHQTAVVERAPSSTTIHVADLLCPCSTVQTSATNNRKRQQVKSDVCLHDQRPHKLQKTCVLSRNDPLHLLLSMMDTQGCKDTNSN